MQCPGIYRKIRLKTDFIFDLDLVFLFVVLLVNAMGALEPSYLKLDAFQNFCRRVSFESLYRNFSCS